MIVLKSTGNESAATELTLTESGRGEVEKLEEKKKLSIFDVLSDEEKPQFQ